jgi:choline dehydrogenase
MNSESCTDRRAATDLGMYDYVIIGAGASAMGLLLGLLTPYNDKVPPFRIALLERGGTDSSDLTQTLSDWVKASHIRNKSNQIYTGRLPIFRKLDVMVGQGLGGTTNINAGLVVPPARSDFVQWPEGMADHIMESVEIILQTMKNNSCLTYTTTPEPTSFVDSNYPPINIGKDEVWKETTFPSICRQIPCASGQETNSINGISQQNKQRIIRRNYYDSILAPLLDENPFLEGVLQVYTNYTAERLLVSSGICTGVEVLCNVTGQICTIMATKEVIVSAGSIETPALLLASGIGRKEELTPLGIHAVVPDNYRGHVGGHLRDHILLPRVYLTRPYLTTRAINGVRAISNIEVIAQNVNTRAQFILMDSASFSDVLPLMGASPLRFDLPESLMSSNAGKRLIDAVNRLLYLFFILIQIFIFVVIVYTPVFYILRYCVSVVLVALTNANSRGIIYLSRKEMESSASAGRRSDFNVEINLAYLTEESDMGKMIEAWRASENAYPNIGVEIFPGPLVRRSNKLDEARFATLARRLVLPYFHWMGTCRMQCEKSDCDDWVVDNRFFVRDVKSLRVCDASIFPTLISAPSALTCAGVGHMLGTMLAKLE